MSSFEEIFASVAGRFGQYGRWAGRAAVIVACIGMLISWLSSAFLGHALYAGPSY